MVDSFLPQLARAANISLGHCLEQVSAPADYYWDKATLQAKANLGGQLRVELLDGRLGELLGDDLAARVCLLLQL